MKIRIPIGASYAPEIKPGALIAPPAANTPGVASPYIYATFQTVADVAQMRDWADWDPAAELGSTYTIPNPVVKLGVAPAGTDPSAVSFSTAATLAADGSFSGNVGSVPAGSSVFAKACFGTSCSVSST